MKDFQTAITRERDIDGHVVRSAFAFGLDEVANSLRGLFDAFDTSSDSVSQRVGRSPKSEDRT